MTQPLCFWTYIQNWKQDLQEMFAHSCPQSTVHTSQEAEATQVSIEWMDEQNGVDSVEYYSILKMVKHWGHNASHEKANAVWFFLDEVPGRVKLRQKKGENRPWVCKKVPRVLPGLLSFSLYCTTSYQPQKILQCAENGKTRAKQT
jgi:hypothetical protein